MTRKYTHYNYNYVKTYFAKNGYTLLNTEYINPNRQKLQYICDKGHQGQSNFQNFKKGHRCLKCAGKASYTIEEVRATCMQRGYTLISKEYTGVKNKLNLICTNGHNITMTYDSFKGGNECKKCSCSGSKAPNWRGGVTPLHIKLRNHPLYRAWQIKMRELHGPHCVITGRYRDVKIHHLSTPFAEVLHATVMQYNDALKVTNATPMSVIDDLETFINIFFEIHSTCIGIPLYYKIHDEFHQQYGRRNNTAAQFAEFYHARTGKTWGGK